MCNEDALLYPHIGTSKTRHVHLLVRLSVRLGGVQNFKKLPNRTTNKAYTALTPGAPVSFLGLVIQSLLCVSVSYVNLYLFVSCNIV